MDKIVIFGFSGGGKSTLARKMGEMLDIEPTHMDRLHWLPGWVENTRENKTKALKEILKKDRWIIDGNYRGTLWKERLELADTAIFIDINRFTCLYHAWKRSRIYKGKTRPDMGEGCNEKFDFEFAKWVFIDGRKKRKELLKLIDILKNEGKNTYILKSIHDIDNFLKGLNKV